MLEILTKLGVDGTIFWQFLIFIITFIALRKTLLEPLQQVIEEREANTTKLSDTASYKEEEADQLESKIEVEIAAKRKELSDNFKTHKKEVTEVKDAEFKKAEQELTSKFESDYESLKSEVSEQQASLLSETNNLSEKLIERVTRS